MRSIQRHLLYTLLAILLVTFSISGVLSYLTTAQEVHELFDAQLIENARVLKGVMNHHIEKPDWEHLRTSLATPTRKKSPSRSGRPTAIWSCVRPAPPNIHSHRCITVFTNARAAATSGMST